MGSSFVSDSNAPFDVIHTSYRKQQQQQHVVHVSSSQLVADNDTATDWENSSSSETTATCVYFELTSSLIGLYTPLSATLCPALLVAALTANPACALVFLRSRQFRARTARNARLYYLALAAGDTLAVLSIPLPWFLGDGLHALSGGRVHWYAAIPAQNG